jgi:hypothetical protein
LNIPKDAQGAWAECNDQLRSTGKNWLDRGDTLGENLHVGDTLGENLQPHVETVELHEMRLQLGHLQQELADARAALSSRPSFSNTGACTLNQGPETNIAQGGTAGTVHEAYMTVVRPHLPSGRPRSPTRLSTSFPVTSTDKNPSGESRDNRVIDHYSEKYLSDSTGHMQGVNVPSSQASGDRQFWTGTSGSEDRILKEG